MECIKNLIIFCVCLVLHGCSLEEDPQSFITPDEFFLEDRDAQSSVDAIYFHLNSGSSIYAKYYWLINALASDLGEAQHTDPDMAELAEFTITAENQVIKEIWQGLYAGINQANYAIKNISKAPISEGQQILLLAEARFLRAFFYFDLMRFFGGVPLVMEPNLLSDETAQLGRVPVDTLGKFIEKEFDYAFQVLPSVAAKGRPNSLTAAAYLCKYYLTVQNYNRAFQASRIIIQSAAFQLLDDYSALFKVSSQNNNEVFWSVNLNANDGHDINKHTLPSGLRGREDLLPTEAFVADFDTQDRRFSTTFLTNYQDLSGAEVSTKPRIRKFWDASVEPSAQRSSVDIPLLRYADVLLMHAESLNQIRNGSSAEALGAINLVRARARNNGTEVQNILPDLTRLNKVEFASAILAERKRELAWEGHRWFDLVRFNALEELVAAAKPDARVSSTHHLMPIPASEFSANKIIGVQNPGY